MIKNLIVLSKCLDFKLINNKLTLKGAKYIMITKNDCLAILVNLEDRGLNINPIIPIAFLLYCLNLVRLTIVITTPINAVDNTGIKSNDPNVELNIIKFVTNPKIILIIPITLITPITKKKLPNRQPL